VTLVGFDLDSGMGGPWNIVRGSIKDLEQPDGVMIDELYAVEKLGVTSLGQVFELNAKRARVVGFTRGIRIFTSQPAFSRVSKRAELSQSRRKSNALYRRQSRSRR
jgi:putative ABC transport system permease protein